jgi:hypothetical protein
MKKIFYITAFGILGLLIAALIHFSVEIVALKLIFGNAANAETFWWQEWQLLHAIFSVVTWAGGLLVGMVAGFYFWDGYGTKSGAFGFYQ